MEGLLRRSGVRHPDSLLTLALHAFIKTARIPIQEFISSRNGTPPSLEEASDFCYRLQNFIKENIPKNIIKMVSAELIRGFGGFLPTIQENPAIIVFIALLLNAVLYHRRMSVDCKTLSCIWEKLCNSNPERLQLILRGLAPRGFCCREYCTDWMLDAVLITCPDLRVLHLTRSSDVTNVNFARLLHLQFLSELHLMGTNIDASGFIRAMNAHPICQSMNSFTCSCINTNDLMLLLQSCPKLGHIGLDRYKGLGSFEVKEKCNIRGLSFYNSKYHNIVEILLELGSTVRFLEMRLIYNVRLMEVAVFCPSLELLSMCTLVNPLLGFGFPEISLFQDIQCLKLNVEDSAQFICYAVSCSKNVKILSLLSRNEDTFDLMLQSIPLPALEQLSMRSLSYSTALSLLRRCPKLRVLAGVDTSSLTEFAAFVTEARSINPHVCFHGPVPQGKTVKLHFFGF